MLRPFLKQLRKEFLVYVRQMRLIYNACLFFLMFIVFFPLTLPPEMVLMRTILPGVVWMAALLVLLLSADRMFQQDYEYGVIEQWMVSGYPISLLVMAKILIHWLMNLIPMFLLCPVIALLFSLTVWETYILGLSLLCATPTLVSLSALAAVFGVGVNQKGALMALILLPLTLPVMIFGSGAVTMAMHELSVSGYLALLTAMSIVAISFLPFAIAGVIRISLVE